MHGHEYRARTEDVQPASEITLQGIQRQVRRLEAEMDEVRAVRENLGMEIDVICNLIDLAELAGVDPDEAFAKKARQNAGREW